MNKILSVIVLMLLSHAVNAKDKQVMLMGTFHFENPGLDVVKTDVMNVMSDESQAYLIALSERISEFKPQAVMLEFDPKNTAAINEKYQAYLAGQFELPANEIYQIGFRVAKLAGVKAIVSLDERSIGWKADALFEFVGKNEPELEKQLETKIAEITAQMNADQKTMNLAALLLKSNSAADEKMNKAFYLFTNAVDAGDSFVGADATASWWHRNLRIYAKIQQQAHANGKVFALAGQGHIAIIRDFLEMDSQFEAVDVKSFLLSE
jgi:hypothetical protein